MIEFLCKTRGEYDLRHKARVYFTCHPADFERSFEKITEDILSQQDCAIYYTSDMAATDEGMYTNSALGRMNLFVVPVSFRLLREPCRALVRDLAYAKKQNIPILPMMLDSGIDEFYSRPEAFGERQYLSPYVTDTTGVSYEEKLRRYLASVLVSEELANRVRAAFDAYIFLSYRKKDRSYADALMRLIHKNPECRDIAIWYDEFLTPGESFRKNIHKALERSELFALLVTPSILEEDNFVMREEYPTACMAGKTILPVEMEGTDKDALYANYNNIPDPVSLTENAQFRERLLSSLSRIAITENDGDAEHNFLIGLAYLEGIDVEVDRERALALIVRAAEDGLLEAMEKLYVMYLEGKGVALDYRKALYWAERTVTYCKENYSEGHQKTLSAMSNLSVAYLGVGDADRAIPIAETVYETYSRMYGEEHPNTLVALNSLALACFNKDDRALPYFQKAYEISLRTLGEEHPDTLKALICVGFTYGRLGEHVKGLPFAQMAYETCCRVLGEEHPYTRLALSSLGFSYGSIGKHARALELQGKAYELNRRVVGEEHPDTLLAMNNLAVTYGNLRDHLRAKQLQKQVYESSCRVLGEEHPFTLNALDNYALTCATLGKHEEALALFEKAYAHRSRIFGELHPSTLTDMDNISTMYLRLNKPQQGLVWGEKAYDLRCRVFGKEHPDTLIRQCYLGEFYRLLGNPRKAIPIFKEAYEACVRVFGEEHTNTLVALRSLQCAYIDSGEFACALPHAGFLYEAYTRVMGETHLFSLTALNNLAFLYGKLGDYASAVPLQEKLCVLRAKAQGPYHADTVKSRSRLLEFRKKLEKK